MLFNSDNLRSNTKHGFKIILKDSQACCGLCISGIISGKHRSRSLQNHAERALAKFSLMGRRLGSRNISDT